MINWNLLIVAGIMPHCIDSDTLEVSSDEFCSFDGRNWEEEIKKKDFVKKEVKAVQEKLEVVARFEEKVKKIEDFCAALNNFDKTIKTIDTWMKDADGQLNHIKNESDKMTPEDRVSYTMELQEDVAAKVEVIKKAIDTEAELLPQGKDEL